MDADLVEALARLTPGPARPVPAAERVARVLREQIVDGAIGPGTRLTEETIGAALGASRNTVREALALLTAERLAVRLPHRGVFVLTPTAADVRDLYATRRVIEPAALAHGSAWTSATPARLREIVAAARRARALGDTAAVAQANQRFHRAVVALAGSHRLDELMGGVLAEMRLVFALMGDPGPFHDPYIERNEEIVDLLDAGDRAGAAAALTVYLDDAEAQLLSRLDEADALTRRAG